MKPFQNLESTLHTLWVVGQYVGPVVTGMVLQIKYRDFEHFKMI